MKMKNKKRKKLLIKTTISIIHFLTVYFWIIGKPKNNKKQNSHINVLDQSSKHFIWLKKNFFFFFYYKKKYLAAKIKNQLFMQSFKPFWCYLCITQRKIMLSTVSSSVFLVD